MYIIFHVEKKHLHNLFSEVISVLLAFQLPWFPSLDRYLRVKFTS